MSTPLLGLMNSPRSPSTFEACKQVVAALGGEEAVKNIKVIVLDRKDTFDYHHLRLFHFVDGTNLVQAEDCVGRKLVGFKICHRDDPKIIRPATVFQRHVGDDWYTTISGTKELPHDAPTPLYDTRQSVDFIQAIMNGTHSRYLLC